MGWRNAFTAALRTPARASQALAITEDESAVQTFRWSHQKLLCLVLPNGFEDMSQVILHLPLGNTDELSQFPS